MSTADAHSDASPNGPATAPDPRAATDHFDGKRFFNPRVATDKSLSDLWRWRRSGRRAAWPAKVENRRFDGPPVTAAAGELVVTFVGHATFLIQVDGLNILTDPVFSERASPVQWAGPKRARAPGIALDALPRIDLVLVSHNHYDHMDLPTLRRLMAKWNPAVAAGLGNQGTLARCGIDAIALDWWQRLVLNGTTITFVPAQHWSRRGLFDRRKTLWGGFHVQRHGAGILFAGDTGYPGHFGEIRERLGPPDLALLPIGAYEPRWFMASQHMDPDEAVRAHRDVGAGRSIAMHFGTFQLTDEGIDAPIEELAAARERHGISAAAFTALDFGETMRWPPV